MIPCPHRVTATEDRVCMDCMVKTAFFKYLEDHPLESFWQALRNWSGEDYIFTGNMTNKKGTKFHTIVDSVKLYLEDTSER